MSHHVARFHERHGPNVVVTNGNTEATWQLTRSGGVLFSEDPLSPGDNVKVTCDGSGRVRIGCTTSDPRQYQTMAVPDSVGEISAFEVMNEIRFHKRECSVYLHLNSAGETITSSCGFLKYDKVIHRKQRVWLTVYILFGDVTITATRHDAQKLRLSPFHGINVRVHDDNTVATTVHHSPGAFCVTAAPLCQGDTVVIRCQPTVEKGQTASNYYLKLLISNLSPSVIPHSRTNFSLTDICAAKPPFTVVETLRKAECNGEVRVFASNDRLEYQTATNKINSQTLWFDSCTQGVWLYLELYRVRLTIASHRLDYDRQRSNPYDYARTELPVSLRQRHHSQSARSASPTGRMSIRSYQYSLVTCGSRGGTLPMPVKSGCEGYSGSYAEAKSLHLSTSCPADLNQDPTDEVDGLRHSLDDLSTQVKTLHQNVDALTTVVAAGTCIIPDSDNGAASWSDNTEELSELRRRIRQNWVELINCLQTEEMGDLLFQYDVISHAELDKIRRRLKIDAQEANRQILDILMRRGVQRALLEEILDKAGDCHLKQLFFKA